jgi:hypothetical protein
MGRSPADPAAVQGTVQSGAARRAAARGAAARGAVASDPPAAGDGPAAGEGAATDRSADDALLADAGHALADRAAEVLPIWLHERCVAVWAACGPPMTPTAPDGAGHQSAADEPGAAEPRAAARGAREQPAATRRVLPARLDEAVDQAARHVVDGLRTLADTDVDRQSSTPLELLRHACDGLAAALLDAGAVPASGPRPMLGERRDGPGSASRRSGDPFGLAPMRWDAIDEDLHQRAVVWGAAKAAVHRRRHRPDDR